MKQFTFRTIIQKDGKEFHSFVPALPGCHTHGNTIEEVRKDIKEAVVGWLQARASLGWDIPVDQGIETIESIEITLPSSQYA